MEENDVNWEELLPGHQWRPFHSKTWEEFMQPPALQLSELLPAGWGGSCAVHSYSEAMTANLRASFGTNDLAVDLPRLLHLAIAKGFLTARGASLRDMDDLVASYGIPLDGAISQLQGDQRYQLLDHDADAYALGTSVIPYRARPMPFTAPRTLEDERAMICEAERAILYREHICDAIDLSPVVLCYELQGHYDVARDADQPYRRLPGNHHYVREDVPWFYLADGPIIKHCVTAYGYNCPGGDVRSLSLMYQENMAYAPGPQPGRHLIHPDAVDFYYFPNTDGVYLSNSPTDGYRSVEYSAEEEEEGGFGFGVGGPPKLAASFIVWCSSVGWHANLAVFFFRESQF